MLAIGLKKSLSLKIATFEKSNLENSKFEKIEFLRIRILNNQILLKKPTFDIFIKLAPIKILF